MNESLEAAGQQIAESQEQDDAQACAEPCSDGQTTQGEDPVFVAARKTADLLKANVANRGALFRILDIAHTPIDFAELEAAIQELTEFKTATQPPYFLIDWLVKTGALQLTDVDADGSPITAEMREDLSEDELDDAIAGQVVEITEAGKIAFEHFDPTEQARDLFEQKPERRSAYLEALAFICEKRSLIEIDRYLRGKGLLYLPSGETVQATSILGKLSDIGAATFDHGWVATREGLRILEREEL